MTKSDVSKSLEHLTSTIENAANKPMLRDHLIVALVDLKHPFAEAKEAVDNFYRLSIN